MPRWRVTLFIGDGQYTSTETHFLVGPAATAEAVKPFATTLGTARSNLLGAQSDVDFCRISDDEVSRDSIIQTLNIFGGAPGSPKSDNPYSCCLVRAESTSRYHKSIYLTGFPDAWIEDQALVIGAGAQASFDSYKDELIARWGFLAVNKDPATAPVKPIVGFDAGPPAVVTVTAHGMPLNSRQQVRLFGGLPKLNAPNGIFQVVVGADANAFTLIGYKPTALWVPDLLGKFQWQQKIVVPYTDLKMLRPCHRKRGGRVNLPLGRSKTKH